MLFEPRPKQTIHFALAMTMVNFGIDLALFGPPGMSELLQPMHRGAWH